MGPIHAGDDGVMSRIGNKSDINERLILRDHGSKVPMDLRGSLPVSRPRAYLILLARNSVFLVRSAYPLRPVSQVSLATWMQL